MTICLLTEVGFPTVQEIFVLREHEVMPLMYICIYAHLADGQLCAHCVPVLPLHLNPSLAPLCISYVPTGSTQGKCSLHYVR